MDEAIVCWNQILKNDPSKQQAAFFIDEIKKKKKPYSSRDTVKLVQHYLPLPILEMPEQLPGVQARDQVEPPVPDEADEAAEIEATDEEPDTGEAPAAKSNTAKTKPKSKKKKETGDGQTGKEYVETPASLISGLFEGETPPEVKEPVAPVSDANPPVPTKKPESSGDVQGIEDFGDTGETSELEEAPVPEVEAPLASDAEEEPVETAATQAPIAETASPQTEPARPPETDTDGAETVSETVAKPEPKESEYDVIVVDKDTIGTGDDDEHEVRPKPAKTQRTKPEPEEKILPPVDTEATVPEELIAPTESLADEPDEGDMVPPETIEPLPTVEQQADEEEIPQEKPAEPAAPLQDPATVAPEVPPTNEAGDTNDAREPEPARRKQSKQKRAGAKPKERANKAPAVAGHDEDGPGEAVAAAADTVTTAPEVPKAGFRWPKKTVIALAVLIPVAMYWDPIVEMGERLLHTTTQGLPNVPSTYHLASAAGKNILHEYNNVQEIAADFNLVPDLFANRRENRARFILQKIMYSNAEFKVRKRADLFLKFIPKRDWGDFSDFLGPSEILKNPILYQGATVRWQGQVETVFSKKRIRLLMHNGMRADCNFDDAVAGPVVGARMAVLGEYRLLQDPTTMRVQVRDYRFISGQ